MGVQFYSFVYLAGTGQSIQTPGCLRLVRRLVRNTMVTQ